ncbi:hypothetical protein [Streptomyces sp. NPDC059010]|uniref:hypothetical protein n=1 Tax=Streptomyces sp. NPDC059010 TaxID=3346695 RepID=UPI003684FE59
MTTRALSLGLQAPPEYTRHDHGGGELRMNWLMPEGVGTGFDAMATGAERLAHLRTLTRGYARSRYFLPVLGQMVSGPQTDVATGQRGRTTGTIVCRVVPATTSTTTASPAAGV